MLDEEKNKLKFTAPQRRFESKAKKSAWILEEEKKINGIYKFESALSEKNGRTVDYEKFQKYLIAKSILNKKVGDFYKKDVWRNMKFRTYSYGKKSVDTFLNKIEKTFGKDPLIAYGNWSRSTQMKYFMPTMNKGLRKLIHKRYDTVTINEYRTSITCCECEGELKNYIKKNGSKVHRLLVCSNCVRHDVKQTVFRNRDTNAAMNIMKIMKSWGEEKKHPLCFQRSSDTSGEIRVTED